MLLFITVLKITPIYSIYMVIMKLKQNKSFTFGLNYVDFCHPAKVNTK